MIDYSIQNKKAWEYNAYDFWVKEAGLPADRAQKIVADPISTLKRYANYFDTYKGIRVANICGSCGKKAVPLAVLGADVTVFDISEDNKRYATELADAAVVQIDYQVCDVLEIDMTKFGATFDVVFMEGGVLHYFHDIDQFMGIMYGLLKPGGKMICSDFHPFSKVMDTLDLQQPTMSYFSTDVFEGEMAHARFYDEDVRKQFPKCSYRKYTISEILNAVIGAGFSFQRFDEHPSWTNPAIPGEFTILANKEKKMNSEMTCRIMAESDIDLVVPLYIEHYNTYEGGEWTQETTYKRIHQVWSREDSLCMILEQGSEVIGFVMGYFEQYDDIQAYDLVEIVLAHEHQGKGIGTKFMGLVEAKVKELGGAMIQLQAVNDDMHNSFYGKLNYQNCTNLVLKSKWL